MVNQKENKKLGEKPAHTNNIWASERWVSIQSQSEIVKLRWEQTRVVHFHQEQQQQLRSELNTLERAHFIVYLLGLACNKNKQYKHSTVVLIQVKICAQLNGYFVFRFFFPLSLFLLLLLFATHSVNSINALLVYNHQTSINVIFIFSFFFVDFPKNSACWTFDFEFRSNSLSCCSFYALIELLTKKLQQLCVWFFSTVIYGRLPFKFIKKNSCASIYITIRSS